MKKSNRRVFLTGAAAVCGALPIASAAKDGPDAAMARIYDDVMSAECEARRVGLIADDAWEKVRADERAAAASEQAREIVRCVWLYMPLSETRKMLEGKTKRGIVPFETAIAARPNGKKILSDFLRAELKETGKSLKSLIDDANAEIEGERKAQDAALERHRAGDLEKEAEQAWARFWSQCERMAATPAASIVGVALKLKIFEMFEQPILLPSMSDDILRLSGMPADYRRNNSVEFNPLIVGDKPHADQSIENSA